MARVATPLLLVLLSLLVAVISTGAERYPVAVRTEKCRRNKVLPISNGKLKRVSKGAEEFLVKCDRGFKAVGGAEEGGDRVGTGDRRRRRAAAASLMQNRQPKRERSMVLLLVAVPFRERRYGGTLSRGGKRR